MRIQWRGLELPTRVVRDEATSTPTYGRFVVEPFERGFGTTVGNGLRRILLSSLEGAAVTDVRIKGAEHEFSTLPGVVEDLTEIILNVKSIIIRSTADEPKTMHLTAKGKKGGTVEVRAAQIVTDPALEIVNTDQLIATLTDEVDFEMEMTVCCGRGYATVDDHKATREEQIIGVIPVDSLYSPVRRVRYRVEDTRVGQRTNYDRLVMEIWTNGTVAPEMALVEAAKILRKHLNAFVQFFELGSGLGLEDKAQIEGQGGAHADASLGEELARPLSSLDLSVRAGNCLASAEILTVGDLIKFDEPELLKLRSFGRTSLREVKRKLADIGLSLQQTDEDSTGSEDDSSPVSALTPDSSLSGALDPRRPPPLDSGVGGPLPLTSAAAPMGGALDSQPAGDPTADQGSGIASDQTGESTANEGVQSI